MKKRAQITVFIIIGLILLLSIGVGIYFYQQRVAAPIKRVVAVPEEVQQIYDYVATCIDQIGEDGLILMGTQGGYIELPAIIDRTRNAYVSADPLGVVKTPMWYYEGEDRTPSLEYMQRSLAVYVKENLPDCVDNFESFKEVFDITPVSDILPVITFTDSEVIIEVKWALDVETQDKLMQLTEFISVFPVRLKPMWELATKVMEKENEIGWFENLTIDLMSANPDIPVSGMEFYCGTRKWHIQQVQQELQNTMHYNMPYIRIENTQYPEPLASLRTYNKLRDKAEDIREDLADDKEPDWPEKVPADVFEMNRMRFDVGTKRTDLKVAFVHQQEWPFFMNAQPNQGGILSTAQMKGARKYLRFLCMNQYHFAYDVIYPVKSIIRDDTAFNGAGYLFQFAFPVIIEDNEESRLFFGLRKFVVPDVGIDFCQTIGTQAVDVRAIGFTVGSPVAEELPNANITYRCLNQECLLGETYSDGTGAIRLAAYLPEGCSTPALIAKKEGYLEGLEYARKDRVDIMLTKLQKMDYSIMVHPYYEEVDKENPTKFTNAQWLEAQSYTKFPKTMHATISISLREMPYDQYKSYPASGEAFILEDRGAYELSDISEVERDEVDFVWGDGHYDIDILLFKRDKPVGGYHAENISVTYEELAGANNVVFHVVEYRPLPEQDYQQAGMFLFLYERGKYLDGQPYEKALRPTFT